MPHDQYRHDAYLRDLDAAVVGHTLEGGVILDRCIFYPTGGGQPGDSGTIRWGAQTMNIATTVKGDKGESILVPAEPAALPDFGTTVTQSLDWDRRYKHMRIHTALHLLSVVIPLPVTGGAITAEKGRLDFNMPEALDNKDEIEDTLNRLIDCDFVVSEEWITDAELDANPSLVKTLTVQPPRGSGRNRLIRIGEGENTADLQPCGGTHVARTSEIGAVRLGKTEKKGKQNRRVNLHLE